jgi:acid phosphatase
MKLLTLSTLLSLAAAAAVPLSERVVGNSFQQWGTLIFENTNFADAEADPNFQALQSIGHNRLLTNYFAITHPSLPNYIAAVAGTTFGIKDDKDPRRHNLTGASIFDRLDAAGISWKVYAEDYPGNCFTGATSGEYAAKHNPAIYFASINGNPARCAKIVPGTQFDTDMQAGTLPQWWWYTPNLLNDGHDTGVTFAGQYLNSVWLPRFRNTAFTQNLVVAVTFDESATNPNHVYTALCGGAVVSGGQDNTAYTHYSLIRTVENNWNLPSLMQGDTSANAFIL